jgi:hypothetical protein
MGGRAAGETSTEGIETTQARIFLTRLSLARSSEVAAHYSLISCSQRVPQFVGAVLTTGLLLLPAELAPLCVLGSPFSFNARSLLLAKPRLVAPRAFGVATLAPRLAAAGLMAVDRETVPLMKVAAFGAGTRIVRQYARLPPFSSEHTAKRRRREKSYWARCLGRSPPKNSHRHQCQCDFSLRQISGM